MSKYYEIHWDFKDSSFYRYIHNRLYNKRKDCKIIIVGRDADLGCGKTTLATWLAKQFDPNFGADNFTLRVDEYISLYRRLPPYSAIVWDELERVIDSRKSMSGKNVDLSHLWSMMRYKQLITIGTVPSPTYLDKRFLEMASVRITVVDWGVALPYKIRIDDFKGTIRHLRFRDPYFNEKEILNFPNMDGTSEYQAGAYKKMELCDAWLAEKEEEYKGVI